MQDRLTFKDILITYLILIFFFTGICIGTLNVNLNKKDNYIQNLEEKLNIYEQSYDEFCLEDSLKQ